MELPDFIRLGQEEPPLRFLIIGGYAVAAHGHTRATFDVDFLVRRADRDAWFTRITAAGLKRFGETRAFAQFTPPDGGDSLDLMFVEDATFEPIWAKSEEWNFSKSRARIPHLEHLLALKLHAMKQPLLHRTTKDAEDIEMLVRRNHLDLRQPGYEALFRKYGNREIYETILGLTPKSEDVGSQPELEATTDPPWPNLPAVVSLEAMMRRNRQLRAWFPEGIRSPAERWRDKTTDVFEL